MGGADVAALRVRQRRERRKWQERRPWRADGVAGRARIRVRPVAVGGNAQSRERACGATGDRFRGAGDWCRFRPGPLASLMPARPGRSRPRFRPGTRHGRCRCGGALVRQRRERRNWQECRPGGADAGVAGRFRSRSADGVAGPRSRPGTDPPRAGGWLPSSPGPRCSSGAERDGLASPGQFGAGRARRVTAARALRRQRSGACARTARRDRGASALGAGGGAWCRASIPRQGQRHGSHLLPAPARGPRAAVR